MSCAGVIASGEFSRLRCHNFHLPEAKNWNSARAGRLRANPA
jgi:hypothetical protein